MTLNYDSNTWNIVGVISVCERPSFISDSTSVPICYKKIENSGVTTQHKNKLKKGLTF